tara:strand:- start:228 stop:800 length:573 start_codon:yes stop_codon:yes gene_type:complete
MSLWGNDIKPKNLTDAEKKEVYATSKGWVREAGSILSGNDNTSATPEVLVAIGGLATAMGAGDITEIEFITTSFGVAAGGAIQARVRFNEDVTVTGTPTLTLQNGNQGSGSGRGPHVLSYASGSNTNELTFSLTIGGGATTTAANDVLTVGANAMALNGGTVKDRGTNTNSTITSSAGIGSAAGSLTVGA